MKRSVRDVLYRAMSFMRTDIWHEDAEYLLHLDARQRAEIRDLKARLAVFHKVRMASTNSTEDEALDLAMRALDLTNKKWRSK